ncbi:hypothetical protein [uncultured Faecalicoccus sp.]|uniref:hypothetical protein n=1 Tax=uncultured Faecalicoccus sp. TaxID=1971760 RepID=UPI00261F941C|nr:hypothetical protein [uncultured Faecalicoccus sp.]
MNNLTSKLKKFRNALNNIDFDHIYHYDAGDCESKRYIVWQEEGEGESNYTNNRLDNQVIQGSVDLYVVDEFDELIDKIQESLDKDSIAFTLLAVQYETSTGFIHYTWQWEVS